MRRVVEFDLVTKIEANARFASQAGMFAKAARTKAQRTATGAVLRSSFASPPPLHVVQVGDRFEHVGAVGLVVRNTIAVTFTRIAPGQTADAWENLPGAFKGVKDEVAAWLGVDDAEGAGIEWKPPKQEKSAQGVYRVRIEIVDLLTGDDRIVRLAETRSEGVQAAARVKRAVKKASARTGSTNAYSVHEPPPLGHLINADRARMAAQRPTARAWRRSGRPRAHGGAAADRLLSPPRDPGEERSAREIADCTTCGARVPDDDRGTVKAARAPRGPRKLVPAARPAGQTVLPMLRAFVALPWEQPSCAACLGRGRFVSNVGPSGDCSDCGGTGRAKGRVLARAARYDGLDEPPASIPAEVPPEHVARYGRAPVVLRRTRFDSRATGPCWVYEANDERTTT